MTTRQRTTPANADPYAVSCRHRLAGWCLAIATVGTPATVTIMMDANGTAAAAGATAVGAMTVAAFTTARHLMSTRTEPGDSPYPGSDERLPSRPTSRRQRTDLHGRPPI